MTNPTTHPTTDLMITGSISEQVSATTMPTLTCRPHRSDAPAVTVSGYAAGSLLELLELCDLFLRTASPAVRAELAGFLQQQPTPLDAYLLIDLVGFNALYLEGVIALADIRSTSTTTPDPGTGRTA